jgi:hypothetical protein
MVKRKDDNTYVLKLSQMGYLFYRDYTKVLHAVCESTLYNLFEFSTDICSIIMEYSSSQIGFDIDHKEDVKEVTCHCDENFRKELYSNYSSNVPIISTYYVDSTSRS